VLNESNLLGLADKNDFVYGCQMRIKIDFNEVINNYIQQFALTHPLEAITFLSLTDNYIRFSLIADMIQLNDQTRNFFLPGS